MAFPLSSPPATYTTVTCADHRGIFFVGETPSFTLDKSGADAYEIRCWGRDDTFAEVRGDIVSSGSVSGTTLTPDAPSFGWNPGFYRLYLTGPVSDVTYGFSYGAYSFVVMRDTAGFCDRATTDNVLESGNGGGEVRDVIMKAILGIGTSRLQITDPSIATGSNPYLPGSAPGDSYTGDSLWACRLGAESMAANQPTDPARPWPIMCQIPGRIDGATNYVLIHGVADPTHIYLVVQCIDGSINDEQVFVESLAGTDPSTTRVKIYFPDSSTLVEDHDNLGDASAAEAVINAASNYVRAFPYPYGGGEPLGGVVSPTAIGDVGLRQGITETSGYLYPFGVTHYEGPRNEPSLDVPTAHEMKLFAQAVHAGHPDAKAMGPCALDLDLTAWRAFLDAGGADEIDAISTHAYNAQTQGDINLGRYTWDRWFDMLAEYGLQDMPVWVTESTGVFNAVFGVHHPVRSRVPLLLTLLMEQYGIPRERNQVWYDLSHGYWSVPTFVEATSGQLAPHGPLYRTLAEETWGQLHHHTIDFGSVQANRIFLGSVYRSASDGTSTAVLVSHSALDGATVTLTVDTSDTSLVVVDGWGNESSVSVSFGEAVVPVSDTPIYVRLPAGTSVYVSDCCGWGATPDPSVSAYGLGKMSGATATPGLGDNAFLTSYLGASGYNVSASALPDTAEVIFNSLIDVDNVVVFAASPWQLYSTLVDFDIQTTTDGSTWTTRATVTKATPSAFPHATSSEGVACTYETWWDEQWIFPVDLGATYSTKGIRVNVRATSYGGEPTAAAATGLGQGYGSQRIVLQEIMVPSATSPTPYSVGGYADTIAGETGLVGYWRLGEPTGATTAVSQVNSPTLDGTYHTDAGAGPTYVGGPIADGDGGKYFLNLGEMRVAHNALLNVGDTFSVEFWLNVQGAVEPNAGGINKGMAWSVGIDYGVVSLNQWVTQIAHSSIAITDSNWHHVVATKNGGTAKIYIDGVDVTVDDTPATNPDTTDIIEIGAHTRKVDEFALYSVALDAATVLNHYNASTTPTGVPEADPAFVDSEPKVEGTVSVGGQVQSSSGFWSAAPNAYTYQWQSSPDGVGSWANVVGATRSDFIIGPSVAGKYLRCQVTAANVVGEGTAVSSSVVGPIGAAPVFPPTNTGLPSISGDANVGSVLYGMSGTWSNTPTGYSYQWQSSVDGVTWQDMTGETGVDHIVVPEDEGLYLRLGVVASNDAGDSDIAYSFAVGPVSEAPSPSQVPMGPCTQWITGDDVADCCNVEVSSGVIFDLVAEQASDLLFSISGRLFAGECERTVRPSCDSCWCGYQVLSRGHIVGPWDYGSPLNLCDSCLLACDPSLVKLAGYPIREVTEVRIGGDILDPSYYRIFNNRYLQRLDAVRWPITQNLGLPDTEENTFSITYTYGADPPALAVAAAAQIACEMYKACDSATSGACLLPTGVTRVTRQGVTIDKLAFTSWGFREGRWATGLALVDAFLASVNPSGLQRRPVFWAPGKRQYAQDWG